DLMERLIAGLLGGPEDDADVHHDVDEQRVRPDEGGEVAALLPAQRERLSGLDRHLPYVCAAAEVEPAQVGGREKEAQVMHGAVESPRLQGAAERLCRAAPGFVFGVFVEHPQDAGEEALAPVRPALALAAPLAADSVHRGLTGIDVEDASRLAASEVEGVRQRRQKRLAAWFVVARHW